MATNEPEKEGMLFGENEETTEPSMKSKCMKYLPIGFSILSIVISVVCIIVISVVDTDSSDNTQEAAPKPICVPCESFQNCFTKEHKVLIKQLDRQLNENNTEQCCAQNATQRTALYKLVLEIDYCVKIELPPVVNPTNFSMSEASMHMKLTPSTAYDENLIYPIFNKNEYNLKFATDENSPLLEHNRNIEILETGTKITESGLYLVYSSVHFKPDSAEPCRKFDKKVWSLTIKRTRSNDPTYTGPILSVKHTCCDDCVRNQETGYTAGVFLLKKDDFLTVDVSGDGLVSYKPQSTFFGLTMLGPTEDV